MTGSVEAISEARIAGTVVALHCSLGSGKQWAPLTTALASRHVVIAPDIAGYGSNTGPFELPTSLAQEVDLLGQPLGGAVGAIHLVGHSYGGALAFKIATDSPLAGRVRSLTLIEPVLPTILREYEADRPLHEHFVHLAHEVDEDLRNQLPSAAIDKFLAYWSGSEPAQEISPKAKLRLMEQAERLVFDFKAALGEQNVTHAAASIRVPTLLLSGRLSPPMTQQIVRRLASTIPAARIRHFPAAGHMLPVSHAAAVNPQIVRHIMQADDLASLPSVPGRPPAQADASAQS